MQRSSCIWLQIPRKLECCIRSLRSRYCTHACCASRYGIASQPSAKPGQFDSGCGEIESSMLLPFQRFPDLCKSRVIYWPSCKTVKTVPRIKLKHAVTPG